jgi:hypothetical protein
LRVFSTVNATEHEVRVGAPLTREGVPRKLQNAARPNHLVPFVPSAERSREDEGLLEIVLELPRPRGVPQLAQRLGLDLADPLARHVEVATDLLERAGPPVLEAEA